jgi:hypothetical protein
MLLAYGKRAIMLGLLGLSLSACKPSDPPPDLLKTQRQALDKAKALGGQMQQQADDRIKAGEQDQK